MSDPPRSAPAPRSSAGPREPARSMWTVGELLQWTSERFERAGIDTPRRDAEHLLAHALGLGRMDLYVGHQNVVDDDGRTRFRDSVRRRLAREPVAYIEGKRGFHALDLELLVDPRVLIPRPETEHLVDWLLEELRPDPAPLMDVVDVGTGSGAIALAIKRARPQVAVTATDRSPDALEVARANAQRADLAVTLHQADLLEGVTPPPGGWTAIAANLPYVASAEFDALMPEVSQYEPRAALDGGADGLDDVRRLIENASKWGLRPGGGLYLEIGAGQAEAVAAIMTAQGFEDVASRPDLAGIPRIVRGFAKR